MHNKACKNKSGNTYTYKEKFSGGSFNLFSLAYTLPYCKSIRSRNERKYYTKRCHYYISEGMFKLKYIKVQHILSNYVDFVCFHIIVKNTSVFVFCRSHRKAIVRVLKDQEEPARQKTREHSLSMLTDMASGARHLVSIFITIVMFDSNYKCSF